MAVKKKKYWTGEVPFQLDGSLGSKHFYPHYFRESEFNSGKHIPKGCIFPLSQLKIKMYSATELSYYSYRNDPDPQVGYIEGRIFVPNSVFQDEFTFESLTRYFAFFISEKDGKTYRMGIPEFEEAIPFLVNGVMKGDFTYHVRRGDAGIRIVVP